MRVAVQEGSSIPLNPTFSRLQNSIKLPPFYFYFSNKSAQNNTLVGDKHGRTFTYLRIACHLPPHPYFIYIYIYIYICVRTYVYKALIPWTFTGNWITFTSIHQRLYIFSLSRKPSVDCFIAFKRSAGSRPVEG